MFGKKGGQILTDQLSKLRLFTVKLKAFGLLKARFIFEGHKTEFDDCLPSPRTSDHFSLGEYIVAQWIN